MDIVIISSVSILILVTLAVISLCNRRIYLNKGWVNKENSKTDIPTFDICSVRITYGCNDEKVAEYKARCWFKTKKDLDCTEVIFYDTIGKYNVGDILELTKTENYL